MKLPLLFAPLSNILMPKIQFELTDLVCRFSSNNAKRQKSFIQISDTEKKKPYMHGYVNIKYCNPLAGHIFQPICIPLNILSIPKVWSNFGCAGTETRSLIHIKNPISFIIMYHIHFQPSNKYHQRSASHIRTTYSSLLMMYIITQ